MLGTKLYKNVKKIYGPYKNGGRLRVIIRFLDNSQKTVSYPKFILQEYLGRFIEGPETVDHIDGDATNNSINNLQILDRTAHANLDAVRVDEIEFVCGVCNKKFKLSGRKLHDAKRNRKRGSVGPFCGRSCAGVATHNTDKYKTTNIPDSVYYTNKERQ